jgi:excisionase family DNA binding protein
MVAADMSELRLTLDDAALDVLADRLAARLGAHFGPGGSPWLNAQGAADYLGCSTSRVRKLTMTGELPVHRDGRRTLYRRDDLDGFIAGGGAVSP